MQSNAHFALGSFARYFLFLAFLFSCAAMADNVVPELPPVPHAASSTPPKDNRNWKYYDDTAQVASSVTEMTTEEAHAFLDSRPGWIILTTFDRNGYPHTIPIGYFRLGDEVFIGCRDGTQKLKNIERDYKAFNEIRTMFFGSMGLDPLPASTGIQAPHIAYSMNIAKLRAKYSFHSIFISLS